MKDLLIAIAVGLYVFLLAFGQIIGLDIREYLEKKRGANDGRN